MKIFLSIFAITILTNMGYAQSVGIGTTSPDNSAILDIRSTSKGFRTPGMTSIQRKAINAPLIGLMVFDTTTSSYWYYGDGGWKEVFSDAARTDSLLIIGKKNGVFNIYQTNMGNVTDSSGIIYDSGGSIGNYGNYQSHSTRVEPSYISDPLAVKLYVSQMDLADSNDSLRIISYNFQTYKNDTLTFHNNQTDTFQIQISPINVSGSTHEYFTIKFNSDAQSVASGYMIKFEFIFPKSSLNSSFNQISGLHFIPEKMAVRGGFDAKNWKSMDSIGLFSFSYGNTAKAKSAYSYAYGENASAFGYGSFAIGHQSLSKGDFSLAFGSKSSALGDYSTVFGDESKAIGNYAFAMGSDVIAAGSHSFVFGNLSYANGGSSIALGSRNVANGTHSFSTGYFSEANGYSSTAIGVNTQANGYLSTAFGLNTRANGDFSHSTGYGNFANGYSSLVCGIYSDSILLRQTNFTNLTPLFIVGNGINPATRKNAFVVRKDGYIGIGTNFPDSKLHIIDGNEATISDGSGFIVLGDKDGINMVIDNDELQGRLNGSTWDLNLQPSGGNLKIGHPTSDGYSNFLGDQNASLSNNGIIVIGPIDSYNMALDNNEIIARENGITAVLHLQTNGGSVDIGNPPLGSEILNVNGDAYKNTGGSDWVTTSDKRLKEEITNYEDGLNKLLEIMPVWYKYTKESGCDTTQKYVGVLAQDIQKVTPYMISESKKLSPDGSPYLQLDNSAMTYMLINAVKELAKQNEELKIQNSELKTKQFEMQSDIDSIKKILSIQSITKK